MDEERPCISGPCHPAADLGLVTVFDHDGLCTVAIFAEAIQHFALMTFDINLHNVWAYAQYIAHILEATASDAHCVFLWRLDYVVELRLRFVRELHFAIARRKSRI